MQSALLSTTVVSRVDWNDPEFECHKRRFMLIDGHHRVASLRFILQADPHFLDNVSFNTGLLEIDINNTIAVQMAGMACNENAHTVTLDNFADVLQQYRLF